MAYFGLVKDSAERPAVKAAISPDAFGDGFTTGAIKVGNASTKGSDQLFNSAAWYFACMMTRARAVAGLPHEFYKRNGRSADQLPFAMPSASLLFKTELDWLSAAGGASYWLGISNRFGVVKKIRHVASVAIELDPSPDDLGYRYYKRNIGSGNQAGQIGTQVFTRQESGLYQLTQPNGIILTLMPINAPSHLAELGPGIAAGRVAMLDASVLSFVSEFLLEYFGGGGVSKTIFKSDKRPTNTEEGNLFKKYINNILKSRPNGEVQVLPSDIQIEHLIRPLKELSIPEISAEMRRHICAAFETPEAIVTGDATNRGDSDNVKKGWYDGTIQPESVMICDAVNEHFTALTGYRLRFHVERLELYQHEETQRAAAFGAYVAAGAHADTAAAMLGLDVPEGYTLTGGPVQQTPDPTPADAEIKQLRKWARKRARAGRPLTGFRSEHLTPAQIERELAVYQQEDAKSADASFHSAGCNEGGENWQAYP